jgi:NAD+ synthase (glutamine-hydrolysing)
MNLQEMYQLYRTYIRKFDAQYVLSKKLELINEFFIKNNLDSVVIGISGGIDSSLVAALFGEASKQPNSPIKYIQCVSSPISIASSNYDDVNRYTNLLISYLGDNEKIHIANVNLDNTVISMIDEVKPNLEINTWAKGQMVSVMRTPLFYYYAAILQANGFKSIVSGTTNRDEGEFIGFYGKASDGMVDMQPIADLHKSEVYELASLLKIPNEIIERNPCGDVFDGRNDEEMIGAPYWFLEMFANIHKTQFIKHLDLLDSESFILYANYAKPIMELHNKNKHKYEVGRPSHFIDVMPRLVKQNHI